MPGSAAAGTNERDGQNRPARSLSNYQGVGQRPVQMPAKVAGLQQVSTMTQYGRLESAAAQSAFELQGIGSLQSETVGRQSPPPSTSVAHEQFEPD